MAQLTLSQALHKDPAGVKLFPVVEQGSLLPRIVRAQIVNGEYAAMEVAGARGALTNRSGTITAGGTAQQLMAANAVRSYLFVQNVSNNDLWINFTTTAVQAQPSIRLEPGDAFEMSGAGFVSTELVSIIGSSTGQAFTAKEA